MTTSRPYFAILGAMRTGSNLLEKTLEELGDTVCYGEAFNPAFVSGPRKDQVLGFDLARRKADPFGFLNAMIVSDPDRIAGFRIFQGHDRAMLEHVLADPACKRIILSRDPLESYVSLKIARATDQWLLRNPRRRTMARIHFDAAEFAEYSARLAAHYNWLDATLLEQGQSAIRITYADLSDHTKLQAVARQIGSSGIVPAQAPTLRQNPESLALKVENYAEMCEILGIEPEAPPQAPAAGPAAPMRPDGFPIAYAPIAGCAFVPVVTALHRIEIRDFARPKLTPGELYDRALRGVLYPPLDPKSGPERPSAFTMVCDPFQRLHAAFVDEMFGPGWRFSAIRRALISEHGGMPPPKGLTSGRADYPQDLHQLHFAAFLQIVAEALHGQGAFPLIAEWMTQSHLFDLHADTTDLTQIFRYDAFDEAVCWLTDLMELPRFPPGQINGMRQAEQQTLLPIQDVQTPALSALVAELYADDYDRFDFARLPL